MQYKYRFTQRQWARRKFGYSPRRRMSDEARAQVLHLAQLGCSAPEVAFLTDWSLGVVVKVIKKVGGMKALRGGRRRLITPGGSYRNSCRTKRLAIKLLLAEWEREDVAFLLQLPNDVVRRIDERV